MLVLLCVPDRWLPSVRFPGGPFYPWALGLTAAALAAAAVLRGGLEVIPPAEVVNSRGPSSPRSAALGALRETGGWEGGPLAEARSLLDTRFRGASLVNPYTGQPLRWGDSPGDFELFEDHRGPVLRAWSLEGGPVEFPWHLERLRWALRAEKPRPVHGGAEEARLRLFPGGEFVHGLRNPFTGEPIREGREPGDAEVVEEGGKILLRAWFRGGVSEDILL
jgi:hypothetical protein